MMILMILNKFAFHGKLYQIVSTHQEAVKSTTTNLVPAAFISKAYCESSPKTRTAIIISITNIIK